MQADGPDWIAHISRNVLQLKGGILCLYNESGNYGKREQRNSKKHRAHFVSERVTLKRIRSRPQHDRTGGLPLRVKRLEILACFVDDRIKKKGNCITVSRWSRGRNLITVYGSLRHSRD